MQLTVTFGIDTNPNLDQVNVQNRMAQAQPNLPPDVAQFGLTMRKSTGLPMMLLGFFSPNKTYDALFLANYANINVVDALYRVSGVGDVRIFGTGDYAMRIWLKPDRLASHGHHRPRGHARGAAAERGQSGRPDRRPARSLRAGHDSHRPRRGPAPDPGGVRRHRGAFEPGRLGGASAGRGADRTRRPQLPADRPGQGTARRRHRGLPGTRLERARRRPRRARSHDPAAPELPRRRRLHLRPGHDTSRSRRASRKSSSRWSKR